MNYNHQPLPAVSSFGPYSNGGTSVAFYDAYETCPSAGCECPTALPGDGMGTFGAVPYSPRKVFLQPRVDADLHGELALGMAYDMVTGEVGSCGGMIGAMMTKDEDDAPNPFGYYDGSARRFGTGVRGGRRFDAGPLGYPDFVGYVGTDDYDVDDLGDMAAKAELEARRAKKGRAMNARFQAGPLGYGGFTGYVGTDDYFAGDYAMGQSGIYPDNAAQLADFRQPAQIKQDAHDDYVAFMAKMNEMRANGQDKVNAAKAKYAEAQAKAQAAKAKAEKLKQDVAAFKAMVANARDKAEEARAKLVAAKAKAAQAKAEAAAKLAAAEAKAAAAKVAAEERAAAARANAAEMKAKAAAKKADIQAKVAEIKGAIRARVEQFQARQNTLDYAAGGQIQVFSPCECANGGVPSMDGDGSMTTATYAGGCMTYVQGLDPNTLMPMPVSLTASSPMCPIADVIQSTTNGSDVTISENIGCDCDNIKVGTFGPNVTTDGVFLSPTNGGSSCNVVAKNVSSPPYSTLIVGAKDPSACALGVQEIDDPLTGSYADTALAPRLGVLVSTDRRGSGGVRLAGMLGGKKKNTPGQNGAGTLPKSRRGGGGGGHGGGGHGGGGHGGGGWHGGGHGWHGGGGWWNNPYARNPVFNDFWSSYSYYPYDSDMLTSYMGYGYDDDEPTWPEDYDTIGEIDAAHSFGYVV